MDKILAIKEIRKRLGVSLIVAKEMYENSEHSPVLGPGRPRRGGSAELAERDEEYNSYLLSIKNDLDEQKFQLFQLKLTSGESNIINFLNWAVKIALL